MTRSIGQREGDALADKHEGLVVDDSYAAYLNRPFSNRSDVPKVILSRGHRLMTIHHRSVWH